MMQAAQARRRNYDCFRGRLLFGRSAVGRVFAEAIVNSIFVVIVHVITHQPEQMSFVQRDDMVQDLSATTSNPSFRYSVLPGRLDVGPLRFQTRRLQKCDDGRIEFRIAIQDHITVWASFRKSLAQLSNKPFCSWMSSDVEM